MARQTIISNQFKLNVKPIYDFMDSHGLDLKGLSKLIGCHDGTLYNICNERRVPSKPTFEKIKEVTGKTDAELLLPLVGGM